MVRTFIFGEDYLLAPPERDIHVALLDINMPDTNGIYSRCAAKSDQPWIQYMIHTVIEDPTSIFQALFASLVLFIEEYTEREVGTFDPGGQPRWFADAIPP